MTRTRTFNPYRAFAKDGKALGQMRELPLVECEDCHRQFNTTMEVMLNGKCEACEKKASHRSQYEVCVTARVQIKASNIVVWRVASESGHDYNVVLFDGHVSSCERTDGEPCNGWRYRHSCHHATLAQAREDGYLLEQAVRREAFCQANYIYE